MGDLSVPSDSSHFGFVVSVTGYDSFTREVNYYKDTECTSLYLGWWFINDNGSIGDVSGSDYKIDYNQNNQTWLASTTEGETFIENTFSSINLDVQLELIKLLLLMFLCIT